MSYRLSLTQGIFSLFSSPTKPFEFKGSAVMLRGSAMMLKGSAMMLRGSTMMLRGSAMMLRGLSFSI
ncbi:hypothetical protein [Nostoc sp. KVJ20]|uniref:hypothetical protein n=1 Tax=Nostoc sp. KVJ20 TaxID=457944 RepID=UPI00114D2CE1|nr:hypothetical protein [Nostoc sp. KVJ20]